MNSVMSKTPPTAKKGLGSGALVVTIAIIPPSKTTTPTTAMLVVSLSGSVCHGDTIVHFGRWGGSCSLFCGRFIGADAAPICTTGGGGMTGVQTGLLVGFARVRGLLLSANIRSSRPTNRREVSPCAVQPAVVLYRWACRLTGKPPRKKLSPALPCGAFSCGRFPRGVQPMICPREPL